MNGGTCFKTCLQSCTDPVDNIVINWLITQLSTGCHDSYGVCLPGEFRKFICSIFYSRNKSQMTYAWLEIVKHPSLWFWSENNAVKVNNRGLYTFIITHPLNTASCSLGTLLYLFPCCIFVRKYKVLKDKYRHTKLKPRIAIRFLATLTPKIGLIFPSKPLYRSTKRCVRVCMDLKFDRK